MSILPTHQQAVSQFKHLFFSGEEYSQKQPLKVYLAGSARLVEQNKRIAASLQKSLNCEVFLPPELVPEDVPEEERAQFIFRMCLHLMELADIIVVNLDSYGKDTASEIGYCYGIGKRSIGFYQDKPFYQDDFIVAGFLGRVVKGINQLIGVLSVEFNLMNISNKISLEGAL